MVDVYYNLERTKVWNGWPLGGEAVVHGSVLFTTELYQQNARNGFNFSRGLTVVVGSGFASLKTLHDYVVDPAKLHRHSVAIQKRAFQVWGYDRQMKVILDAVEDRIRSQSISTRNVDTRVPTSRSSKTRLGFRWPSWS